MYKNIIIGKKLVLFDLDGTIVDTESLWQQALANVMSREGLYQQAYNDLVRMPGLPNKEKWLIMTSENTLKSGKTVDQLNEETTQEFINLMNTTEMDVMPGFWELAFYFKKNKELKLGLTTNSSKEVAEKILAKVGIKETFDYKVFGDEVKKLKPEPEIYKKVMDMARVKPREVLVFEDSPTGAAAAEKADLDLIVIWNGVTTKGLYPERTIFFMPDFEGLANNLEMTFEEAFKDFQKIVLKKEAGETNQQTQTPPHEAQ